MPQTPADLVVLPRSLASAFRCLQDVPILHLAEVTKINRRGKRQRRIIVVAPAHVYSCMENGSIQRCVAVHAIAAVHTWSGEGGPHIGLKIPDEYDMLLGVGTVAEVAALVAALQTAARNDANNNGRNELQIVEETEMISAAAYRLERPKGFQRTMASTLHWCLGSVGNVPAVGREREPSKPTPFVSANSEDIFVVPAAAHTATNAEGTTAMWEAALPLDDGLLDATHAMWGSGIDYSDDEDTENVPSVPSPAPAIVEETRARIRTAPDVTAAAVGPGCRGRSNSHENNNTAMRLMEVQTQLEESHTTLQTVRRNRAEERAQWCLLLAAERRNTYQLRQTIADLQAQVIVLTSQNLALREEAFKRCIV
ncbi:hypothetical protein DQ04_11241010 [Trypanosoma grayi]|uniref:hypothetical protein n=1 Tax=Trypanosoma grayi TaxID=71804 RepID=UPI0004F4A325|nr:hypothetical protein DQ04_11241010 [Trypanosoma grayi]KEG07015.1 hypothetical protein DQ04_11241010 [Trypanosoma grayi]